MMATWQGLSYWQLPNGDMSVVISNTSSFQFSSTITDDTSGTSATAQLVHVVEPVTAAIQQLLHQARLYLVPQQKKISKFFYYTSTITYCATVNYPLPLHVILCLWWWLLLTSKHMNIMHTIKAWRLESCLSRICLFYSITLQCW